MNNSKKPWQSTAIVASTIGSFISMLAFLLSFFKIITISEEEQKMFMELMTTMIVSGATLFTSLQSFYGRWKAEQKISLS